MSSRDGERSDVQILCVDDDPSDLFLVTRALRRYRVEGVEGGEQALAWIADNGLPDVVITDQYMRGMDGLELLSTLRRDHPDIVRVLLTGHAELELALKSVNEGHIYQILLKSWPQPRIVQAAESALRHAQLLRTERELVETTLAGAVRALGEALALANPVAVGHTLRVQRRVGQLLEKLQLPRPWEVEMAAQLSQLGTVHIPPSVLERVLLGRELKDWEQQLYDAAPAKAVEILGELPRLEGVLAIVRWQGQRFDGRGAAKDTPRGDAIPLGSRILRVAVELDKLEMQGLEPEAGVALLARDRGGHDPAVLSALRAVLQDASIPRGYLRRNVPVTKLVSGMVFAEDVYTNRGLLLSSRNTQATAALLERIRSFALAHGVKEVIEVFVPVER